jgi:hypothetical protein
VFLGSGSLSSLCLFLEENSIQILNFKTIDHKNKKKNMFVQSNHELYFSNNYEKDFSRANKIF